MVLKALPPKDWVDLDAIPREPLLAVIVANQQKMGGRGDILVGVAMAVPNKNQQFKTKLVHMNLLSVHIVFEDRLSAPTFKAKE